MSNLEGTESLNFSSHTSFGRVLSKGEREWTEVGGSPNEGHRNQCQMKERKVPDVLIEKNIVLT